MIADANDTVDEDVAAKTILIPLKNRPQIFLSNDSFKRKFQKKPMTQPRNLATTPENLAKMVKIVTVDVRATRDAGKDEKVGTSPPKRQKKFQLFDVLLEEEAVDAEGDSTQ